MAKRRELHGCNAGHIGSKVVGKFTTGVRAVSSRSNDFSVTLYALSFDGSSDNVDLPNTFGVWIGDYTFEFWIRLSTIPFDWDTAISFWGENYVSVRLNQAAADKFQFNEYTGSADKQAFSSFTYSSGVWYHLACVKDTANGMKLYIDGVLEDSNTWTGNPGSNSTDNRIGEEGDGTRHTNMDFADLRIWNYARTQTEIQNNANSTLTGNETGLVAYYPTDSNSGTTLVDNAGANDGTINGATWVERSAFPQI